MGLHSSGRLHALPGNINLGWKGRAVSNILDYYVTDFRNKQVFVIGKPFQPSLIFVGEARSLL